MDITQAVNQFYYEIAIQELRLMHENPVWNGVTYHSMMYLDVITCQKHCTVSTLAQLLHVSKAAVTMKVHELERQGLLEKRQSEKDKRVFYLTVKQEVRERYQAYDQVLHGTDAWVREHFNEDEIKAFCTILTEVSRRYTGGNRDG